jgi:hypothetical protein
MPMSSPRIRMTFGLSGAALAKKASEKRPRSQKHKSVSLLGVKGYLLLHIVSFIVSSITVVRNHDLKVPKIDI